MTVVCLSDLLSCTLPLSRFFQKTKIDIKSAQDMLQDTFKLLERKRNKCEEIFANIYDEICSIAKELEVEIKLPRKAKRQVHRENYPSNSPIDYYRQSVYIPIIEHVTEDLKLRFPQETVNLYYLSVLFPDSATFNHEESMQEAAFKLAQKYSFFFKDSTNIIQQKIISELNLWRVKWEAEKLDPSISALELLKFCDSDIFPTLHIFLRILITLPSSAASEKSFSTIRRLKTWLRSVMSEDRLIGLALLNIFYFIYLYRLNYNVIIL